VAVIAAPLNVSSGGPLLRQSARGRASVARGWRRFKLRGRGGGGAAFAVEGAVASAAEVAADSVAVAGWWLPWCGGGRRSDIA